MHPFRPTLAFLLVFGIAPIASAQTAAKSAEFFKTYCTECHGHSKPKGTTESGIQSGSTIAGSATNSGTCNGLNFPICGDLANAVV